MKTKEISTIDEFIYQYYAVLFKSLLWRKSNDARFW